MDIRRIKYFIVLAEELHFRRAAARLCISQPPLSNAIRMLENELGTALFARSSKKVTLTAAGAAFYPQALRVLSQLELACVTAKEVGAGSRGRLDISFVSGMSLRGVPEALTAFAASHRDVAISLHEIGSPGQLQAILHGHMAGGFLHHSGTSHPGLQFLAIAEEPFVCCVPSTHPLASKRQLDLRDLAGEDFVFFSRDASPASHDNVIAVCAGAGFSPVIRHHVTGWITALLLVSRGAGVALVPEVFTRTGLPNVVFLKLKNASARSVSYFAWRRDSEHVGLRDFVSLLRARYQSPPA
ncbi:MAG: LysR family transcriptional regulator [Pseudomonadota bacterium]